MRFRPVREGSRIDDRPECDDQRQVADQDYGDQASHQKTQPAWPAAFVGAHFAPLNASRPSVSSSREPEPVVATFP